MKVTIKKDIWIPAGFFCGDCCKKSENKLWCEEFGGRIFTSKYGKIVKCERCILATREAYKESC